MNDLWSGVPAEPEVSGWHWVEDASGLRPLLWRGDDWPDRVDRREWEDGIVVRAPADMREAKYFGPVATPAPVADRFRATRLRRSSLERPASWMTLLGLR